MPILEGTSAVDFYNLFDVTKWIYETDVFVPFHSFVKTKAKYCNSINCRGPNTAHDKFNPIPIPNN